MPKLINLTGQRFGRWLVLHAAPDKVTTRRRKAWHCRCDCGAEADIVSHSLRTGDTTSCGCFRADDMAARKTTHGMAYTREYHRWDRLVDRCRNPNHHAWHRYGGRGIKLHPAWYAFDVWHADVLAEIGPWPGKGHTLDRIDNNGHYEPGNIRWATAAQQRANQNRGVP